MSNVESTRAEQESWIDREVGGKYRIVRLVGRGGMGAVYEAENLVLGKRVALKFIDIEAAMNADGFQRFIREARAASAIESAHIVQVFDVGNLDDGRPYIVMELLRGENLGARLQRCGRLTAQETVHIAVQVLRGLHRAHDNGIVHRDLKPENVFLVETEDDPMFAKVVDFGISKITRRSKSLEPGTITQEGVVLGTPFYMAPEQAQALVDLDERADLWSLGAIMYECLSGRRPFLGDTYEQVIIAICTKETTNLYDLSPDVPKSLASLIMQALARDRDDRYPTAKAFIRALREAVPELCAAVPPTFDPATHRRPVGEAAPGRGPQSDVSWSEGDRAEVEVPPARGTYKIAKLAIIGSATALIGFAMTVGVMHRMQPKPDPSHIVQSQAISPASSPPAPPLRTAHVDSSPPNATADAEGHEMSDRVVPGKPGQTTAIATASASTSGRVAVKQTSPPRPSPPSAPTSSNESSSLTGGLELKTDIP